MKAIDSCPIGKWKWTLYIMKCLFISPVEASTTLQTQHKHTSPFSSLLLVHIHLIVLYRFHVCKGVFILVYFIWITVPMKSPPVDLPKRGGGGLKTTIASYYHTHSSLPHVVLEVKQGLTWKRRRYCLARSMHTHIYIYICVVVSF